MALGITVRAMIAEPTNRYKAFMGFSPPKRKKLVFEYSSPRGVAEVGK